MPWHAPVDWPNGAPLMQTGLNAAPNLDTGVRTLVALSQLRRVKQKRRGDTKRK